MDIFVDKINLTQMVFRKFLLVVGAVIFSWFNIVGQQDPFVHVTQETSRPEDQIKKEYPYDIQLKDADGLLHNSANVFKNNKKATVLLFWMTTCGPCRMELNAISGKFDHWKKEVDFDFFAVSMDFPYNYYKFTERVKKSNWPFPSFIDVNREFRYAMEGGLNGLPQLFVLNKKGKIIYHTRRYMPGDEDKLFQALKSI